MIGSTRITSVHGNESFRLSSGLNVRVYSLISSLAARLFGWNATSLDCMPLLR